MGLCPIGVGGTCGDEAENDDQDVHRLHVRGAKVPVHMENPFLYEGDGKAREMKGSPNLHSGPYGPKACAPIRLVVIIA